ncbi:6-hexanolactone hydrolase [Rasamsonia emersonii CBS 393.64]|uniref:6-hexanolactone hydrolase n=1 Tax=Rasamsonia emersonii (strain ATCC 16479 / CBS 393.64 / IMI 116815) TaxID=1408163 RepID=A0A0F4Z763_RASE3|nr:6-hexanolactone hydrolase [Rasamsonia emersonii CBS 393.64]KKA25936.1 6-hexanolactone hydrolase [Rasamsonia emersonii CBS 393.64]
MTTGDNPGDDYPPRLSVAEKASLCCTLLASATSTLLVHGTKGIFRGRKGAKHYSVHLAHALVRTLNDTLTTRQYQYLLPPTYQTYEAYAKRKKFQPETVRLPRYGGMGHWLGSKTAKNVLFSAKGGGFALSANDLYFDFCWDLIQSLHAAGHDLSVFFVSYTLTPHAIYPTQLKQCVEALRYILREAGFSPENVFLGGDSAGANVALAVLLHVSHHPHPEIIADEADDSKDQDARLDLSLSASGDNDSYYLGGIFCLGPWVDFNFDRPSEKTNRFKDCLSKKSEQAWAREYVNGRNPDGWNEPAVAPAEWWKGVRVREFLILAGSDEILLSGIGEFAEKVQSMFPRLTFFIGQDEGHVSPIVDRGLFGKKQRARIQTAQVLKTWFAERLLSRRSAEAGS